MGAGARHKAVALLGELLTELVSQVVEHPRSASEEPECRGYRVDHNPNGSIPTWFGLCQLRSILPISFSRCPGPQARRAGTLTSQNGEEPRTWVRRRLPAVEKAIGTRKRHERSSAKQNVLSTTPGAERSTVADLPVVHISLELRFSAGDAS